MSDKIRRAPHDTENPFAQISRLMLQDKTLSYEARGLLGYLLSKSGNWELRISDLQIKGAGRDKIYRILGELQAKGYIGGRKKYQDEKGYWQWTPYDVYETRELNPYTDNPYTDNPYTENTEIKAVKKNTKQREQKTEEEKKEITTISASAESAVSPVNDWSIADEADDAAMFVPKGKKQISAQAENGSKRLSKPTATTPPSPTPSPPAPVAVDDVETFSAKLDEAKGEKINPAVALGEAWGIAPANGDFSLYMRKAKELLKDIPIEEFKAYCDWRKKQAGDFASKLTIATLTGNGHVSAYLAQRNEAAEKARKQRELEEQLYARYPQLRPRETSEPVEYMPADEVQRMMDMVLNPPTRQENVS
jgi:hypothetical protein